MSVSSDADCIQLRRFEKYSTPDFAHVNESAMPMTSAAETAYAFFFRSSWFSSFFGFVSLCATRPSTTAPSRPRNTSPERSPPATYSAERPFSVIQMQSARISAIRTPAQRRASRSVHFLSSLASARPHPGFGSAAGFGGGGGGSLSRSCTLGFDSGAGFDSTFSSGSASALSAFSSAAADSSFVSSPEGFVPSPFSSLIGEQG